MSTPAPPPGGNIDPPVCPRHPDRVSYVRCQRCNRPACPECQRPAAVGVQCVDCVKQESSRTRSVRTAFGAKAGMQAPVVTYSLIAICAVVNLLQRIVPSVTYDFAFVPVGAADQPYRFLTSAFLHSTNLTHILFNMIALWILGRSLEPAFGRVRFLSLYLVSAVGGSVGVLLLAGPDSDAWLTLVLGASGAVFGLFGAMFVALKRLNQDTSAIIGILVVNVIIGFVVSGISWQAHLGGLVTGALLGIVYAYAPRDKQRVLSLAGTVAILLLLAVLAWLKLSTAGAV